jgi:hypothetical protein
MKISRESEFRQWFEKNYEELGYSSIVRKDIGIFPDYIMLRENKKVKVELEIFSSSFISHKHPVANVDEVICIKKDADLPVKVIEVSELNYKKENKRGVRVQELPSGQLVITIPKILAEYEGLGKGTEVIFKKFKEGAFILEVVKKKKAKIRRKK